MKASIRKKAPRIKPVEKSLLRMFTSVVLNTMFVLAPGEKPCYDDDVITACLKALCADEYDAALALAEDKARKRQNEREAADRAVWSCFTPTAADRAACADLQSENGGGAVC